MHSFRRAFMPRPGKSLPTWRTGKTSKTKKKRGKRGKRGKRENKENEQNKQNEEENEENEENDDEQENDNHSKFERPEIQIIPNKDKETSRSGQQSQCAGLEHWGAAASAGAKRHSICSKRGWTSQSEQRRKR